MARPTKLNADLQAKIVERLQAGSTIKATCDSVGIDESTFYLWSAIGNAILDDKPHERIPRLLADRDIYIEFVESTTRAQADGMIQAAVRFRQGMNPYDTESVTTETLEETRLDKEGKPYTYRRTLTKKTLAHFPGDWRAAMEYLARRDPANWAQQKITHELANADGKALVIKVVYDDTFPNGDKSE